jgi:hypothetical protein
MSERDDRRSNHKRSRRHREDDDDRQRRERPRGTGYGTEQAIYREYLGRRWDGSNPPTPQAYLRAAKLWRQLPGSIVTTAADLGNLPEPANSHQSNDQEKNSADDKRD